MDFSKFSDENFEVKDWVNSALRIREERTPVDAHASTLVMKLQLFIQEVNNALEETSKQAVSNIPRVLREIENIRHEAAVLKDQMQLVKEDIKKVEENTSQSMKMLMELDTVKSRMQAASSALQEADNWTTLSSDVDKVFESGDVKAISAKLLGMQKSLSVLQDVPDFAERRRLLEGLKNKLEALLSTKIVTAFNNHALDETKDYVRIFTDIDRLDQLQNYYVRCHKTKLQRTWTDVRTEDPNRTMLEWLSTFYDVILSTWHTEITWGSQVFPEPGTVLCVLLTQTLTHLDPSLPSCISEYIKDVPHCLRKLIELRQVTLRFAQGLEKAIFQHKDKCKSSCITLLVDAVFSPYTQYMLDYPVHQQSYLINELQTLQLKVDGFLETSGYIAESVEKVFLLAEEAINCCVEFTDSFGVCSLACVLEEYFSTYAVKLDECISGLRKRYRLDTKSEKMNEEEIHEDWTLFQNAFRLIQVCGELLLRTSELDELLYHTVMNLGQELENEEARSKTSSKPFPWYNYLHKERASQYQTLIEFVQKLQSGGAETVVLFSVKEQMQALNERAHMLAFDIIFVQIKKQFANLPNMEVWSIKSAASGAAISDELPTFSLSPQGYITHIGDFLLTLPQQLEPFVTQENPALDMALKTGRLPFHDPQTQEEEYHPASDWLGSVARGAMHTYVESIQRIHQLTPYSTKQLITDIEYFCNVLGALEVEPSVAMTHIEALLKASPDEFHDVAAEHNIEDRIRIAIGTIRNIH